MVWKHKLIHIMATRSSSNMQADYIKAVSMALEYVCVHMYLNRNGGGEDC